MTFSPTSPFRPTTGISSPHLQTLFASFFRKGERPPLRSEIWDLEDGDFVDVDLLEAPPAAPHLLVLHGLEGSSRAGYVTAILRGAHERGWGAVAMSFRSCGNSGANRSLRMYHSGETQDALSVLRRMRERVSGPIAGVGFSLGGNVILRILEEGGESAPLDLAAVVSVPLDLHASVRSLDGGGLMSRIYRGTFLRSLRRKALVKAELFPASLDPRRIRGARTLEAFDDAVTAPLHGFESAADYYEKCSSGPWLSRIRRPTLYLASRDDPFLGEGRWSGGEEENPHLIRILTEKGGHVGFVMGRPWAPRFWAEEQVLAFLGRSFP